MRRTVQFLALLPRNVCVAILRAYRAVISPLYGDVCRYYPSCSSYTLRAIQTHGAVRGIGLGAWRIVRCNPWASGGIDDVPHSRHEHSRSILASGFVVPADSTPASPAFGAPVSPTGLVPVHSHQKG